MKRLFLCIAIPFFAAALLAGFKAKPIKPKKPEQFQVQASLSGITVAADLLLSEKQQKEFFYKALTPSNVIPLRLAVFNDSNHEVVIPLEGIRLTGPDGTELPMVEPPAVAEAVLKGYAVSPSTQEPPVQVAAGPKVVSSRTDPADPGYDPRLDPTDPRYDPSDPRSGRYDDRRIVPGVDVILNPSGGGGDFDEISARLVVKDFTDKAYMDDPILPSMKRDRFIYFSIANRLTDIKGFELSLPEGRSLPGGLRLKF